jgi:hypothetical protein
MPCNAAGQSSFSTALSFNAAHGKSLFIPWAILAVLLVVAGE